MGECRSRLQNGSENSSCRCRRCRGENALSIIAWRVRIKSPEAESGRDLIVVSGDMTYKGGSVSMEEDSSTFAFSIELQLLADLTVPWSR